MKLTKSIFHEWLHEEISNKGKLRYACLKMRHINKIKTELFVINSEAGDPLCIFEVLKDSDLASEYKGFLLSKMPSWCLNLPGYAVLCRQSKGNITTFRVRKFTPRERFVGDFSPREFAGFMASTIIFCRKQLKKEAA
jgi:hypothetical protein